MKEKVFLREVHEYQAERLTELLEEALESLGAGEKIKPGMKVVIKPNLVIRSSPDSGIITHPAVVAAAGLAAKRRGAEVLIAESSGGPYTPVIMNAIFSACGYKEIAERCGFSLYTECKHREVDLPEAVLCRRLTVVEPFLDADYIIDVAKLKSHCMTRFSGAVKNLFGVVPGLMKPEIHCRFPEEGEFVKMLVDLCEFIRPSLSVMDAIDGMEGDGPTGGTKRHIGLLGVSESPYALDLITSAVAEMKPGEILYLRHAMERGLCPRTREEVELDGSLEGLICRDFKQPRTKDVDFISRLPQFLRPLAKKLATPRPSVQKKICVGCGKCAESCPQHVIAIQEKKAVIDPEKCIRCFCCHEMCPLHAIRVKRFSPFGL